MVLTVGNYQISVQRRRDTRDAQAAREARLRAVERQAQAYKEAALARYRELSGQTRLY